MVTGVIAMKLTGWHTKLALIMSMCAAGATGLQAQTGGAANATSASDPNHVKAALIIDRMLQMNKQRHAALTMYLGQVQKDGSIKLLESFKDVDPGAQCPKLN